MQKYKVSVFVSGDQWAGVELQTFHTICALQESGEFDISALLLNQSTLSRKLGDLGIKLTVADETKLSPVKLIHAIKNYISAEKPDLIHVHEYKFQILTSVALAWSNHKAPLIRTVHNRLLPPKQVSSNKAKFLRFLELTLLKHYTDGIITVSNEIQQSLIASDISTPINTIHNGIPTIEQNQHVDCGKTRADFGVPGKATWIGTAARLEPVKNLSLLLKAAHQLKRQRDDFCISIFGDGSLRDKLISEISELHLESTVLLHGHTERMQEIMPCWDIFVLSSFHEGIPISLIEAMSLGITPVCTRVGGVPEVVKEADTGLLVENDNPDAFARALDSLIEDSHLRREIGTRARNHVALNHSIDRVRRQYEEHYRSVLSAT